MPPDDQFRPLRAAIAAHRFGLGEPSLDHGTGAAAFVLGGAVAGGKVVADWPGLAKQQLNEGRDLKITTDLRAVLRGVLSQHLHVSAQRIDDTVFPDSAALRSVSLLKV